MSRAIIPLCTFSVADVALFDALPEETRKAITRMAQGGHFGELADDDPNDCWCCDETAIDADDFRDDATRFIRYEVAAATTEIELGMAAVADALPKVTKMAGWARLKKGLTMAEEAAD